MADSPPSVHLPFVKCSSTLRDLLGEYSWIVESTGTHRRETPDSVTLHLCILFIVNLFGRKHEPVVLRLSQMCGGVYDHVGGNL